MGYTQASHSLTQETDLGRLIHAYNEMHGQLFKWLILGKSPKKRYANSRRGYVINALVIQEQIRENVVLDGVLAFERVLNELNDYSIMANHGIIMPLLFFRTRLTDMFIKIVKHSEQNLYLFDLLRKKATKKFLNGGTLAKFYATHGLEILGYCLDTIEHSLLSTSQQGLVVTNAELSLVVNVRQLQSLSQLLLDDFIQIEGHMRDSHVLLLQDHIIKKITYCQILGEQCTQKFLA